MLQVAQNREGSTLEKTSLIPSTNETHITITAEKVGWCWAAIIGVAGILITSPLIVVGASTGGAVGIIRDAVDPQKEEDKGSGAFYPGKILYYSEAYFLLGGAIGSLGSIPLLAFARKNLNSKPPLGF